MLDPRLLLNKGESLVDVGEDWPYSAGDVYVSHRLFTMYFFQSELHFCDGNLAAVLLLPTLPC